MITRHRCCDTDFLRHQISAEEYRVRLGRLLILIIFKMEIFSLREIPCGFLSAHTPDFAAAPQPRARARRKLCVCIESSRTPGFRQSKRQTYCPPAACYLFWLRLSQQQKQLVSKVGKGRHPSRPHPSIKNSSTRGRVQRQ